MNKEYLEKKKIYLPVIPCDEKLTSTEEELDLYLSKIKAEADKAYRLNNPYGIIEWDDKEDIHPELYEFCKLLPKGGDLHAHDNTMISIDRFEKVISENTMIVLDEDGHGSLYTINSPNIPESAIKVDEAIEKGMLSVKELHNLLIVSDEDEEKGYWNKLEKLFSSIGDIYNDIPTMEKVWEEGFLSCYEKGVTLLEIRDYAYEDDLMNIIRDRTIREAYYRVRRIHPDFLVRLIGCSGKDSENTIESACETLRSIIRVSKLIKDEFDPDNVEDFIIGLDLVSEEDNSKSLSEFTEFLMSDEIQNCGLKLFLHCGESLRTENDSVIDAYLAKSYRVGHALNLYRFPQLLEEYKKDKIAIEVCLMSNYRLGYVRDLRLHPGLQYLVSGIPIVLCSDDGLFMSRAPMVDDFYSAILCWDLNLGTIKGICRNSITYSGLSQKEIDRVMNDWQNKWNEFVSKMIAKLNN